MNDTPEGSPDGGPEKASTGTYRAAAALHAAAIELSQSRTSFAQPADSHATVGELIDAQQHLMKVLYGLGQWYQHARVGTDYADGKQSVDGVLETAFELQAALQHATALHQALIRAHHAGSQVRWYNPRPDTKR
ncbi:hypothetical protein FDK12_14320 [Arthrobacter sp. NamB2]|uniref:hypothetical protein n=1 Tax=Arthrobacter sp. NamB2 TaxID=2576035 RepID=UPI0010C97272|nr:hypothetical protein [Arthrobacter sp. NamB2]TKV26132.1 hypothetical protein FDK12_14320 [Arthrobacter sp. NamB2]